MVAKSIDLGPGLRFSSIKDGKAHFKPILDATPIGQHVTPQEFAQLKVLYETYCANTNWPLLSPPVAFGTMLEQFETKCFSVEFADGRTDRFSLDKALSKVSK
jgi:hypothetical protein